MSPSGQKESELREIPLPPFRDLGTRKLSDVFVFEGSVCLVDFFDSCLACMTIWLIGPTHSYESYEEGAHAFGGRLPGSWSHFCHLLAECDHGEST